MWYETNNFQNVDPTNFKTHSKFVKCSLSILVFLNVTSFVGMVIIVAILNVFRTWLHVTVPIAFGDHLPLDR